MSENMADESPAKGRRKGKTSKPSPNPRFFTRLQTNATMSHRYYDQVSCKSLVNLMAKAAPPAEAVELKSVGVEDMIAMDQLSEQALLDNLELRYKEDIIYTYTSSILVAVNPFKDLPIYGAGVVKQFVGQAIGSKPPHIYAIAEGAYSDMMQAKRGQSVIISGESGAGKSESARLILQYLSARTERKSAVETMILETVPVLEALGNARTVRNNNSSRFGKYINIQFDTQGFICGVKITSYLLEKSRVVQQSEGERNYHVFYQLCEGSSLPEKEKFQLLPAEEFAYLNQGCTSIPGVDEMEEWKAFKHALRFLQISFETQELMFRVLSGVLHLGNAQVGGAEKAQLDLSGSLATAAALLGVPPPALAQGLSIDRIKIGGDMVVKNLGRDAVISRRDALGKLLYQRLFAWLLEHMNNLTDSKDVCTTIGVLDIFGFENFKVNSFEQFCINFANERLQLYFNDFIFRMEQDEYTREGIDWSKIEFNDNQACLDLIQGKNPLGVLVILDEECRFPKGTDQSFLEKICQQCVQSKHFNKDPRSRTTFGVNHYAGLVTYEIANFLAKNKDTVPEHFPPLFANSNNAVVKALFEADNREAKAAAADPKRKGKGRLTVGTQFMTQLDELMKMLSSTNPFFVRCIKPNMEKKPDIFTGDMVADQMRYAGMMETIRIRQEGYPIRHPFEEFYKRYKIISLAQGASSVKEKCGVIMKEVAPDATGAPWQLGNTKVFMRDGTSRDLEKLRNQRMLRHVIRIQAWFRMVRAKRLYARMQKSIVIIQKWTRMFLCRKKYLVQMGEVRAERERIRKEKEAAEKAKREEEERERKRVEEEERAERERVEAEERAERERREEAERDEREKREEEEREERERLRQQQEEQRKEREKKEEEERIEREKKEEEERRERIKREEEERRERIQREEEERLERLRREEEERKEKERKEEMEKLEKVRREHEEKVARRKRAEEHKRLFEKEAVATMSTDSLLTAALDGWSYETLLGTADLPRTRGIDNTAYTRDLTDAALLDITDRDLIPPSQLAIGKRGKAGFMTGSRGLEGEKESVELAMRALMGDGPATRGLGEDPVDRDLDGATEALMYTPSSSSATRGFGSRGLDSDDSEDSPLDTARSLFA